MAYFSTASFEDCGPRACGVRRRCGCGRGACSGGGFGESYLPGGFGEEPPRAKPPALFPPRIDCRTARAVDICLCPLTEEERINCDLQRMLRTPPPAPAPRRSLSDLILRRLDEAVASVLRRLNVPPRLQKPILDAARSALSRGSTAVLNEVLGRLGIRGETREAIEAAVRAAARTPAIPTTR
jgi:hypothetical protein